MNIDELKLPVTSELEELVLGELLSYPSGSEIETISGILKEEMFSSENARKMWKTLLEEYRNGRVPDAVTIERTVGMEYVSKVMIATVSEGVSPLNALRHAAALHDCYVHRKAYMVGYNLMRVACDETSSVADMLSIPSGFIQQVKSESSISFS